MGRIIDVSLGIGPELVTWPGDPGVEVLPAKRQSRGDPANVSELRMGSHTGTHVDAPSHFVEGGKTIDEIDPDALLGPAVVVDLRGAPGPIGSAELEALDLAPGTSRVLLRTRNSGFWASGRRDFPDDYVALAEDGARWAIEHDVRLVGIDFLSIERSEDGRYPVHHTLLEKEVVIVEGLDLSNVTPELYLLYCLPLKISGIDGAPARVFLVEP